MQIAVVGAGPAGSAAACHLALAGCAVTLIDRTSFPRDKVCGDWLTPLAVEALGDLGVDRHALRIAAPTHTEIRRGALGAPMDVQSVEALEQPGLCVPRRRLDAAIRARALAAGCRAEQRTVRDPGQDTALAHYDVIVDARGANVGTPNAVGLRAYWTVPASALDEDARATVTLATDAAFARGYGWWFPVAVERDRVCVNVGVGLLAADSRPGHHVSDFFARFVAQQPAVRRLSAAAIERGRPVGYHVGLAAWRNRVAEGRVLRIGDAANLADPLTGDGIGNALRSGALAARAIAASRDAGEAAQRWQSAYERDLAPDLRIALALRRALSTTFAKNLAVLLVTHQGALRRRLHGALFGATDYRALMPGPARRPSGPPRDASA